MYLFAGIGNIGKKYSYTRHNIGFLIIDKIIKQYDFKKEKKAFDSYIYRGLILKKKVMIIKPMTFVNNSGEAISKLVSFYKIPLEKIFVFHEVKLKNLIFTNIILTDLLSLRKRYYFVPITLSARCPLVGQVRGM